MAVLLGSLTASVSDFFSSGSKAGSRWQAAASGDVATITMDGIRAGSTFTSLQFAIYADSAGAPAALLGTTGTTADTSVGSRTLTLGTPVTVVSGTFYWLALLPLGGSVNCTLDTTGQYDGNAGNASFPDPFGADTFGGANNIPMIGESAAGASPVGRNRSRALLIG